MGGVTIAVVEAFTSIEGTENAGMVAYYRAPGCTEVTIADVLPILSKINYYEDEYVVGEMLIWDTGEHSAEPNNCAIVRVIVYNDGWICAWFDKTTQNQLGFSGAQFVDDQTIDGFGTTLEYENKFNGCQLKITNSTDPDCPVDTVFTIRFADYMNGYIKVHNNDAQSEHFNSGYSYNGEIYMTNGNLIWWGDTLRSDTLPSNNSNRLYRAIYEIWTQIKDSSNSTNSALTNASLVYMYDSQTDVYTNETNDFNDIDINDCQVLPTDEVINDAFYIGSLIKFNGVSITMGTPGIGSAITWEYFNGSVWSTLTAVDGSIGFISTGELTFDPPDDWVVTLVNAQSYFWVRARVTTASYVTTPLLSRGQLYLQNNLTYIDNELGIYNFEYTSANYVMLCGRIDIPGDSTNSSDYYYTTILPGKVVYNTQMSVSSYTTYSVSQGAIYYNGTLIFDNSINYKTYYGYNIFDLNDISYSPGTQNVTAHIAFQYSHYTQITKSGIVLICS